MKRKKKDEPVKGGEINVKISILFHFQIFILIHTFYFYISSDEVNFKRVKVTIGNENKTIYDENIISIHKDKITRTRVSLGKVLNNLEWKTKLRNVANTVTKICWLGARILIFLLHNIINYETGITDKTLLVNMIHACFTIDTYGTDNVPKALEDNVHCFNWYTKILSKIQ